MRHYTLYIYRIAIACLLMAAWVNPAMGQGTIQDGTLKPDNEVVEVLYVNPDEQKSIVLQKFSSPGTENLDGYIRWYSTVDGGSPGITGLTRKDQTQNSSLTIYTNGYAWTRTDVTADNPKDPHEIYYEFSKEQLAQGVTVVCDASSIMAELKEEGYWPNRVTNLYPRRISVRRIYHLKDASERAQLQGGKLTEFGKLNINLSDPRGSSLTSLLDKPDWTPYLMQDYEIHLPLGKESTFRLPERLDNYYPGGNAATDVRWIVYDGNKEYLDYKDNTDDKIENLITNPPATGTTQQRRYILTAVKSGESDWHPVSLLKLIYDPYAEHLTESELANMQDDPNYKDRFEARLLAGNRYERIADIGFQNEGEFVRDIEDLKGTTANKKKNIRDKTSDLNLQSFYAFADPLEYEFKRYYRATAGRGEYGLYRTLNYPGISGKDSFIDSDERKGKYTDYFASNGGYALVDHTYEETKGEKLGYFFYLDAADRPGVITKIGINQLCSNTSLIGTAWVCDAASGGYRAEIGFTFKKRDRETGKETILAKYYTGRFAQKKSTVKGQEIQAWQQVFFKFSFSQDLINEGDDYLIEVANNCPSSNGADYAVDDIRVYRSLPNIDVQRKDACSASTLEISSDYETVQRNMGWDVEPDVLSQVDDKLLNSYKYRKFRYGLMGPTLETDLNLLDEHLRYLGNIYYGFVKSRDVNAADPNSWITISKQIAGVVTSAKARSKSLRVVVPTDLEKFEGKGTEEGVIVELPGDLGAALRTECKLNIRAIRDFVQEVEEGKWKDATGEYAMDTNKDLYKELYNALYKDKGLWNSDDKSNGNDEQGINIGAANVEGVFDDPTGLGALYETSVVHMFKFLQIPRIRCPWHDGDKIYLDALHVDNTDLHFAGEIYYDEEGKEQTSNGKYYVVMFNADNIKDSYEEHNSINLKDPCTLISPFYVVPSVTIAVDTKSEATGMTCIGSIHTLEAKLMVANVDDYGNIIDATMNELNVQYPNARYTFDWFLGSMEDYNKQTGDNGRDLQAILAALRGGLGDDTGSFTVQDVNSSSLNSEEKKLLTDLLGDNTTEPRLVSGKEATFRWVKEVVAIPYVPDIQESEPQRAKMFCTKPQAFTLAEGLNVPEAPLGYPNVGYPDNDQKPFNAPLRLGMCHITSGQHISNVPIRSDKIRFGVTGEDSKGTSLRMIESKKDVFLRQNASIYTKVGELDNLYVDKDKTTDKPDALSFHFTQPQGQDWNTLFQEGQTYQLYIPFGEYDSSENLIDNSCEGYIVMDIKIVPEYLTWTGSNSDAWYNDDNWQRSTKAELYRDDKAADKDVNDNTDVENAFSPLYFSKITIPSNGVLNLSEENGSTLNPGTGATLNIQYDMAVYNTGTNDAIEVVPYYGNKVDQIYFKPEAKLVNQHFLNYEKAWVEFEMSNNDKRWFASPLQDVYAGDFYAPKANGRQETEAFTDINYNANTNSRWAPAFYQKAWNSAINYATEIDGISSEQVAAVKSNWSIEYNDVTVKYPIGKGFYLSVEDVPTPNAGNGTALVRLPKADDNYNYEQAPVTKAAGNMTSTPKTNSGQLAAYKTLAGTVTVKLSDLFGESAEDVAGDATTTKKRHFLVGNPYMTYLNMTEFFNENDFLAKKYWRLENGTARAVVGTPDVDFENGATTGTVEPMEAFFVELAANATVDNNTITFTPSMMSATEIAEGGATTKGATATNPVITITAERGEIKSVSTLSTSDRADNGYKADEDAVVLLDSELDAPMVYTVAGSLAAQVNAVKSIRNIGLGIYNEANDEVTLTIEGLSRLANPLYLYDSHTRKSVKLEDDSYSLRVAGDSHGRYFLRDSELGSELENTISIYSARRGQVIVSSLRPVKEIKVFGLNGSQVRRFSVNTTRYSFDLPAGIYMIHAGDGEQAHTEKVIVR